MQTLWEHFDIINNSITSATATAVSTSTMITTPWSFQESLFNKWLDKTKDNGLSLMSAPLSLSVYKGSALHRRGRTICISWSEPNRKLNSSKLEISHRKYAINRNTDMFPTDWQRAGELEQNNLELAELEIILQMELILPLVQERWYYVTTGITTTAAAVLRQLTYCQ